MKWTKRLKWLRISKLVIPIAFAISVVFAGFAVFADEAENFVVKINSDDEVSLSLAYKADMSDATERLVVPVGGSYTDVTWDTVKSQQTLYDASAESVILPDDIAKYDGIHSVYKDKSNSILSFFSFSFYLQCNSTRTTDVDMEITIDQMITVKTANNHIDGAVRVMVIEGEPLLSANSGIVIYKKVEEDTILTDKYGTQTSMTAQQAQEYLVTNINYNDYTVTNFQSDSVVMSRSGDMCYKMSPGEIRRFTIVLWLEGWDAECVDEIRSECLKMSMSFTGR